MEYLLLFAGLFILAHFYIQFAVRHRIVDRPNIRSSHSYKTVRGGGIIFPISALSWFVFSGFQFPLFFTGLIVISIISFWDDLSHVSPKLRLVFQIVALSLLLMDIQLLQFSWWTWIPVLILSVWIINVYNFMDGINGITGIYSFSVLSGIWIVNNYQEEFISNELIYFLMISIAVFSYFNFRTKAKCFAGDVGSISMAYIIGFLLAKLIIQSGDWLYILFLGIYGVDTGMTIYQRLIQKENIFTAHRQHLYQLMANELKIPHLKVATLFGFTQLIICLITIVILENSKSLWSSLIAGTSIIGIMAIVYYGIRIQVIRKTKALKPRLQNQM